MRVVCIGRRESEYGRTVEEWLTEFERRSGEETELISPDEPEGERLCRVYGVMEYPTIMVLTEGGAQLAEWHGQSLPTFDEVIYWARK